MTTAKFPCFLMPVQFMRVPTLWALAIVAWALLAATATGGFAADLKVMKTGLGSGTVTSTPAGISCGSTCDAAFGSAVTVMLTATADSGSTFEGWDRDLDADSGTMADCAGTSATCTLSMAAARAVRPKFRLTTPFPVIGDFTPEGLQTYLTANPNVTTPARFISALPEVFRQGWILMSRSESLQTGTAEFPRILMPSADDRLVFSAGLAEHGSYPGAHPNAIEYMQWDAADKNFRFHEIVLDPIPAMGSLPARPRGVSIDDAKCSKCHSTQNVLNRGTTPGTTGLSIGALKAKNKPNWDSYDSWGGMLPFNRDRIYQGSVEAAAIRRIFNPWTWRANGEVRAFIEQLQLQPPGVSSDDMITRLQGGANDGHVKFAFDASSPIVIEPAPAGSEPAITTNYSFDGLTGTGTATSVERGGTSVTLQHPSTPISSEGRGVQLFDLLGGADGQPNAERIADELIGHRFATGSHPIDVRATALAIFDGCMTVDAASNSVAATPALTAAPNAVNMGFFDARNGMAINGVVADTLARAQSLPRRKADIQKRDADRADDPYLLFTDPAEGLVQHYGAATSAGTDTSLPRLRQEVFRRPIDAGSPDATVMGGIYVDREIYSINTDTIALARYFLEPLGVSVDKWSMGVRGRSRTYTFADVLGSNLNVIVPALRASLGIAGSPGSPASYCPDLVARMKASLTALPAANEVPTYTDVQRIFNRSCIECHGGLNYPPYANSGTFLDFSENENPNPADPFPLNRRLGRSHERASAVAFSLAGPLFDRINRTDEDCFNGMMPCGGPPLSRTDIETLRRWITGGRPYTEGDPHIRTIGGVDYDFQAAGEFVLLRDEGLEIQARHTPVATAGPLGPNGHTGLTSCVSVNSAVAVGMGSQRITYQPNLNGKPDPEGLQLRIDGKLVKLGTDEILLASGGRIIATGAPNGIQIESNGGTAIVVTPSFWIQQQVWYLNIDIRQGRGTMGLAGAISPGNWLPALPDGTLLGPRPGGLQDRYDVLYGKFGDAWRVDDKTTLFDYAPGASTASFTDKKWPLGTAPQKCSPPQLPGGPKPQPPGKPIKLEVAKKLCGGIKTKARRRNCVQDVSVTGEAGFAKTYASTEALEQNQKPDAPVLEFPNDQQSSVGRQAAFAWKNAAAVDKQKLTYRLCVWGVDERFGFDKCSREAIAANRLAMPDLRSGKAYFWKVLVEDGRGGTAESQTRRLTAK